MNWDMFVFYQYFFGIKSSLKIVTTLSLDISCTNLSHLVGILCLVGHYHGFQVYLVPYLLSCLP